VAGDDGEDAGSDGKDRQRDWQWEAPDIVAELNSGVPIKPQASQPQSSEQNETIAA
jgi:hypothetical protein